MFDRLPWLILLLLALAPPLPAPCQTTDNARSDAELGKEVRAHLINPDLRLWWVNVEVNKGVVSLSGTVPTREQAAHAIRTAASVPGVTNVVNLMQISPDAAVPEQTLPAASSPPLSNRQKVGKTAGSVVMWTTWLSLIPVAALILLYLFIASLENDRQLKRKKNRGWKSGDS